MNMKLPLWRQTSIIIGPPALHSLSTVKETGTELLVPATGNPFLRNSVPLPPPSRFRVMFEPSPQSSSVSFPTPYGAVVLSLFCGKFSKVTSNGVDLASILTI